MHHLPDEAFTRALAIARPGFRTIICDHLKSFNRFSLKHSLAYWLQRMDRGKFVRPIDTYQSLKDFILLEQQEFMIHFMGIPGWPYFAYAYASR
jgi:hypothetical protein